MLRDQIVKQDQLCSSSHVSCYVLIQKFSLIKLRHECFGGLLGQLNAWRVGDEAEWWWFRGVCAPLHGYNLNYFHKALEAVQNITKDRVQPFINFHYYYRKWPHSFQELNWLDWPAAAWAELKPSSWSTWTYSRSWLARYQTSKETAAGRKWIMGGGEESEAQEFRSERKLILIIGEGWRRWSTK